MDTNEQAETILRNLFSKSADVLLHEFTFNGSTVIGIKCDSMVDQQILYSVVLPTIENLLNNSELS